MPTVDPRFMAHQRARFTHPDAYRYVRRGEPPAQSDIEAGRALDACRTEEKQRLSAGQGLRRLAEARCDLARLKTSLNAIRMRLAIGKSIAARKYSPDQPRVPAGEPGGGRWTDGNVIVAGVPRIPRQRPPTAKERHAIIKAVSVWLADSGLAAADFVARGSWLHDAFPAINAYLDAPRSLGELHGLATTPERGYDIHHIVEQTPASRDGFSRTLIDREDNLVRVPTLKHWQINAWFQARNEEFDGLSPREYLQYKDWDERRRVGLRALILHGVLAP